MTLPLEKVLQDLAADLYADGDVPITYVSRVQDLAEEVGELEFRLAELDK